VLYNKEIKMKKSLVAIFVLAFILAFSGCGKKEVFTFYSWEGMFPPEVLKGFEKEFNVKINYVNFEENETMLARLQAANGGDYDLIIADDYITEIVIAENLATRIDKSKIPNYKNINSAYQGQFYDLQDLYTIPYGAGVQTIMYDPRRVTKKITGYADLWDPVFRNRVGIIGNFRVINGMALKVNGESYNTNDIQKIFAAGDLLLQLSPNIRIIKDDQLEDDLLSGEVTAAVMYTSQVTMAKLADPALAVVFPKEGIGFGIMPAFIPVNAPNADAAYKFLNYILDPQRGAACFEYLGYYSTFSASDAYIRAEYKEFLTLPEGFNTDMEMIQNISPEAEEAHNLIWTAFRSATR
jgi:spermidine/putrescine-binding protein